MKPSQPIKRFSTPAAVQAIVIGPDGTLLNTAPQLSEAANRMLRDIDYAPVSQELLASLYRQRHQLAGEARADRRHARHAGCRTLRSCIADFEKHYTELLLESRVFEGVIEGLDAMRAAGFRLGCIPIK